MPFLSRYAGTIKLDLSDLADDGEYWVTIKKTLTADETDRAEDARLSATNVSKSAGRAARGAAARRRAGRSTPEDDETVKTLLNFNTGAYKQKLLEAAITDWNLTDEHGVILPLRPAQAKTRSIAKLPTVARDRIFEAVDETMAQEEPDDEDGDADFRDGVPSGGGESDDDGSADPGSVGEGGLEGSHWPDARAGYGDV